LSLQLLRGDHGELSELLRIRVRSNSEQHRWIWMGVTCSLGKPCKPKGI